MATVFPTINQQLSIINYQPTTNNQLPNMAQSVDQTSIKDVTSRRHNDPPGLWIAVVTSSVALHLLVFWLMRYDNGFTPWFPRASQTAIPIEVIEISPSSSKAKPQLKVKIASLKPAANQQSSTLTPTNENSGGINFGASRKQKKRNTFVSKSNTQLVPKKFVSKSNTQVVPKKLVPTPKPVFTPTPTPTDSLGNLGWKRERERISLGKPTPLPKFTPVEPSQSIGEDSQIPPSRRTPRQPIGEDSPTQSRRNRQQPTPENSPTQSRRTPRQPIAEDSPTQSRRTPRQPIGEDSPTQNRRNRQQPTPENSATQSPKTPQQPTKGGLIAISRVTPEEQRSLMRNPPPEGLILPEYVGSNEKQINSLSIKPNLDLPEKEFLVSLVIDKAGNFQQAVVEDGAIAPEQRHKYEEFANSIFRGEKFQPARHQNGTPVLEWTNRFVRIKIQHP